MYRRCAVQSGCLGGARVPVKQDALHRWAARTRLYKFPASGRYLRLGTAAVSVLSTTPEVQVAVGQPPGWCVTQECLASLYQFPHLPASKLNDNASCSIFVDIISRFAQQELADGCSHGQALVQVAATLLDAKRVQWYPGYGCALLAIHHPEDTDAGPQLDEASLFLVCLDEWEHHVHTMPGGAMQHTAVCRGHKLVACGSVPLAQLHHIPQLVSDYEDHYHAQKNKDPINFKGLQRTPAFIKMLVVYAVGQVLESLNHPEGHLDRQPPNELPHGGFMDVGRHSGGEPKDTCWPLVRETAKVIMSRAGKKQPVQGSARTFQYVLLHLDLWLLQQQLVLLTPALATPYTVTAVMLMLRSAASKAAQLADAGLDMTAYTRQCATAAEAIRQVVGKRVQATAKHMTLATERMPQHNPPRAVLPAPAILVQNDDRLDSARQQAIKNLNSLPMQTHANNGSPFSHMLQFVNRLGDSGFAVQYRLHAIEQLLFQMAASAATLKQAGRHACIVEEGDALVQLVHSYRAATYELYDTEQHSKLVSCELLVAWITYCLLDAAACHTYPNLMQEYGVSLDWQDLQHLVPGSKLADDAALGVAAYLQDRCRTAGTLLFSLRDGCQQATFEFARAFAASTAGSYLQDIWLRQQQESQQRIEVHWEGVQRQQRLARLLRIELRQLRQEYDDAVEEREEALREVNRASNRQKASKRTEFERCQAEARSKKAKVEKKQHELVAAEAAPAAVVQPLPSSEHNAMPWLFFLHMPQGFRQLSQSSFLAQQLLLPWNWECTHNEIKVPGIAVSLTQHYNKHQRSAGAGCDGLVSLVSYSGSVPYRIGPSHVDHFNDCNDGIWWPDGLQPAMQWAGSGQQFDKHWDLPKYFNPFGLKSGQPTAQYFTITLDGPGAEELEPYVFCSGSVEAPRTRGNLAIAQRDAKLRWLTKPGFLGLARLRSYPLQQLQRLCVELKKRTLPLGQPVVQQLVHQLVHQLGPLQDGPQPTLLWRTGWKQPGGVLATLAAELQSLADELQGSARDQEAVLLLGQLAAYIADYHHPCLPTARQFAAMTASEADAVDPQIAAMLHATSSSTAATSSSDTEYKAIEDMRAKQLQWRVMALTCYSGGTLTLEDAASMVQLAVLVKHGSIYHEEEEAREKHARLVTRAQRVMAARAAEVLQHMQQEPDAVLTPAIRRVLQRAPQSLQWVQLQANGAMQASWEALADSGALYSINVLDGTVLCNGLPPARLQSDITKHPLFLRVFGDTNFEVQQGVQPGVLQTAIPVHGRYYDFHITDGAQLTITEIDAQHGVRLELLDPGSISSGKRAGKQEDSEGEGQVSEWAVDLPTQLRDTALYSHWLCREQGVVILRPPHFQQHDTLFICKDSDQAYHARRVPAYLQSHQWQQLQGQVWNQLQDTLVVTHNCHIKSVLSKFEDPQYIHTYSTAAGTLLYELPRYGLEFELKNARLCSRNFKGYVLSHNQQLVSGSGDTLEYTLPEFSRYLVLQQTAADALVVNTSQADIVVLVPQGKVQTCANGTVDVKVSTCPRAQLQVHRYDQHTRFGHLQAASVPARLQLAALYAATSTLLPEPRSRKTGAQMAMQLVRQCWVNKPLQKEDLRQLQSISGLGGYLAAGLPLLVHELQASTHQLLHLYPHLLATGTQTPQHTRLDHNFSTAWEAELSRLQQTGYDSSARLHMELSAAEESRVQRTAAAAVQVPDWLHRQLYTPIEVPDFVIDGSIIYDLEKPLMELVQRQRSQDQALSEYPLKKPRKKAGGPDVPPLVKDMHNELRESWEEHQQSAMWGEPFVDPDITKEMLLATQAQARQWRVGAEDYIFSHISEVPAAAGCHAIAFKLHQLSSIIPLPAQLDIVRCAEKPELIARFNPFLSAASCQRLHEAVLVWLQLAVLEDRVQRALALLKAGPDRMPLLVQELETFRCWDVRAHPSWLMFEVEGQLQIRPTQYTVAQHLMDNPGAIVQLNMGEGKTRVILPMLALHWADGNNVVRLNLLAKLMDEAHSHLHRHLCASVLNRKLFTLPFHRDVQLTEAGARAVKASLEYCKQVGGVLLVAPEHRLSLQLKWHELHAKSDDEEGERVMKVLESVSSQPYVDILDESDELLHHRFQLIYAMGSTQQLPSREQRVHVLQVILRTLSQLFNPDNIHHHYGDQGSETATTSQPAVLTSCSSARAAIHARRASRRTHTLKVPRGLGTGKIGTGLTACNSKTAGVAVFEPTGHAGCFSGIRLLRGEALDRAWPQLRERLVDALLTNPAYELGWIKQQPDIKDLIKQCVIDDTRSAQDILGSSKDLLTLDEYHHVLALRGFLACGLLLHCLQLRTQVDFGINRSPTAPKRLAVPYRAAHTPSERSEFAQPDIAILLTHISMYRDGLTRDQLVEALAVLMKMGPSAREEVYKEWLQSSRPSMTSEHLMVLDTANKIDTTSSSQLELLHQYYSHNQAVVDFWLAHCVLPIDTQQFTQRLSSSSWDIAHNPQGKVVGFSGTNDNHRLLPLQVRKSETGDRTLQSTNGKMLDLLVRHCNSQYHSLQPDMHAPLWQQVLDLALQQGVHTVIDCGALLSGTNNRNAAQYLLKQLDQSDRAQEVQGVTYYDIKDKRWTVLDLEGRSMPLESSPIRPASTFTVYDDARCRGADLQLRQDAVGLITLGPTITKDKLMQAAGRLRQIGRGQTLQLVGTQDVTDKIRARTGQQVVTSREVLEWVMQNTVQATMHGLCAWSQQGLHYAAVQYKPDWAVGEEVLDLEGLYSSSTAEQPVPQLVQLQHNRQQQRCGGTGDLPDRTEKFMAQIVRQASKHGEGFSVRVSGGVNDECERELERQEEEEEEEETEIELPHVEPAEEQDWPYDQALVAKTLHNVFDLPLVPLQQAATLLQPSTLASLGWSTAAFCTQNHLLATADGQSMLQYGRGTLNEYLRPVDSLLLMPSGQLLLLSEREADMLQLLMWQQGQQGAGSKGASPVLLHLAYLEEAVNMEGNAVVPLAWGQGLQSVTAGDVRQMLLAARSSKEQDYAPLASVKLWNGDCLYAQGLHTALRNLVQRHKEEVQTLVASRGKLHAWSRSDLEQAASE